MAPWLALAAVVVVALGLYAAWTARRLDRLHARLDAAAAGLHAQLRARAVAADRFAATAALPSLVRAALREAVKAVDGSDALDHQREVAENAVSRSLRAALAAAGDTHAEARAVIDEATRASFARSFHNDAVRDVLVLRRRWVVRLLRLAGRAPRPAYFEIDDAPVNNSEVAAQDAPYD